MKEEPTCGNCIFWRRNAPANDDGAVVGGACRYDPPKVFMVLVPEGPPENMISPAGTQRQTIKPRFTSSWPAVASDRWCGKHKEEEGE